MADEHERRTRSTDELDILRLRLCVEDLDVHGPWSNGWEAAEILARGPAGESLVLVAAAIAALHDLGASESRGRCPCNRCGRHMVPDDRIRRDGRYVQLCPKCVAALH